MLLIKAEFLAHLSDRFSAGYFGLFHFMYLFVL